MNTFQINEFLICEPITRPFFLGVFAFDQKPLPPKMNKYCFCLNTEPHWSPGVHWLAIVVDNGVGTFFDSYGNAPFYYNIVDLNIYASKWYYNHVPVQSPLSNTCGLHCIFYLVSMCYGYNLNTIIQDLYKPNDLMYNEAMILLFLCNHLIKHKDSYCNQ